MCLVVKLDLSCAGPVDVVGIGVPSLGVTFDPLALPVVTQEVGLVGVWWNIIVCGGRSKFLGILEEQYSGLSFQCTLAALSATPP